MDLNILHPQESRFLAKCFILMKMGNKCPVEIPENLRQIQSLPKPQSFSSRANEFHPSALLQTMHGMHGSE